MDERLISSPFEVHRRQPNVRLVGNVAGMTGYREHVRGDWRQHGAASLNVPLIIGFGSPFRISLGDEPNKGGLQTSFAAGLHLGPVRILSDGRAERVQVDFTPLGAARFFGRAMPDLASRMVGIADLLGAPGRELRDRLGSQTDWQRRFDTVEEFLLTGNWHAPSSEIIHAYGHLARSAGTRRVADVAASVGWSRKHLTARFNMELGLAPKALARLMRFENACRLAREGNSWSAIAADSGYADQSHLVRDFNLLAGEGPRTWAQRNLPKAPAYTQSSRRGQVTIVQETGELGC